MEFNWSLVQLYPFLYNVLAPVLQLNIQVIISLHSPTHLLSSALSLRLFLKHKLFSSPRGDFG